MVSVKARAHVLRPTLIVLFLLLIIGIINPGVRWQADLVLAMIFGIGAVGLDVLAGFSGQYVFGQIIYFAIGAYMMAGLQTSAHFGWLLAVVAAVACAGLVAFVLGSALVRLRAFGAAITTFFSAAVVLNLLEGSRLQSFTGGDTGLAVPPVTIFGLDPTTGKSQYFICLGVLAFAALLCIRYISVRAGLSARVIKQSPVVAAVLGIRVNREKIRIHVLAGMLAALGGCLYAWSLGYLSPESFDTSLSIDIFAMAAVGGLGSISGPILGAVFFYIVTDILSTTASSWSAVIFSVVLLAVVIFFRSGLLGLVELVFGPITRRLPWLNTPLGERLFRRRTMPAVAVDGQGSTAPTEADFEALARGDFSANGSTAGADTREELLTLSGVTLAFGGMRALNGVSMAVRAGAVHAIIGPNGAGKTSLLNCISGLQALTDGSVSLRGRDMAGISVSSRRGLGISRTFQHPSLVADLDVMKNVELGAYETHDGGVLQEILGLPSRRRRTATAKRRAEDALNLIGFPEQRRGILAEDLTMGEQKQVDIARAISSRPALLLLDEPTAGLGPEEIQAVARAVKGVQATGITVLVIAHHVGFVREVAEQCTVLDFGQVVTEGEPADVLQDQRVVEVFVGSGSNE